MPLQHSDAEELDDYSGPFEPDLRLSDFSKEALMKLAEKEVDVLMTDIGLPGMSGLELALEALSRNPSLRVIFMTGHSVIDGQDDHAELQSAILLTKPFDERGLAAAIESARAGA